jgi:hypothetical protein
MKCKKCKITKKWNVINVKFTKKWNVKNVKKCESNGLKKRWSMLSVCSCSYV